MKRRRSSKNRRAIARKAIARYAAQTAGSRDDLDKALEAASLELWQDAPDAMAKTAVNSTRRAQERRSP